MRRAFLFVLLLAACRRQPPNVLLVTFDTTRADHIDARIAPNVTRLAAEGTSFTTAVASQPLTAPSHSTILTGRLPYHHGVRNNGAYQLGAANVTLAERLRAAGYATHAIVASYVLDSRFGFDQGFDSYDDDLSQGAAIGGGEREIGARLVADKALRWLQTKREKPFFLWLHFYDPHARYTPPADIAARFPGDPYSGEIHYADRELGRVLDALRQQKQFANTLIVFTADHGESLGEHGEAGHGLFVYDSTTRVPMVFTGPHVPLAQKRSWVASHADLVPTILDLAGLEVPKDVDGVSLAKLWDRTGVVRHAYSETSAARANFGWSELRSMRSEHTRVVEAPRREAYDLARERVEAHNLYSGPLPSDARPLFAELARIRASDDLDAAARTPVDEETRKQLAALGYITGSASDAGPSTIDPKDRVATWAAFHEAQALLRARQLDRAAATLRGILASEPGSAAAATLLATALAESGRTEESLEVLQLLIERHPTDSAAYLARASLLREVGRNDEARVLAEAVLRREADNTDARIALADTYLSEGRFDLAEGALREALRRAPGSSAVLAALGNCLNRAGRLPEAIDVLERARAADPNSQVVAYNYAVVLERAGRLGEALQAYRGSLRLDPEHSMSWNNLGSLLDRAGRRQEAIACIARAHRLDPRNAEASYNLGALLLATGRAKEAIPLLEQAARQRPDLAVAQIRLQAARAQAAVDKD